METKQQTKKVAFCCPNHGILRGSVEYFSVDMGTKMLVDIPVIYCSACRKYYTPFANLLALVKLQHNGWQVAASQGQVRKDIPREVVKVPRFIEKVSIEEKNKHHEEIIREKQRRERQLRIEKAEQRKRYIDGLREVLYNTVVLTNKNCFIGDKRCPRCKEKTKKEHVKIKQDRKYVMANVWRCGTCDIDYISPAQFTQIYKKASDVIRGFYWGAFVSPVGIQCEWSENGGYLCIPKWALDFDKYDHKHLPPRGDAFYDMTDEEYSWVVLFHQPEEFLVQLRKKSFLAEAGYSTSESEIRRHSILTKCVNEYGKSRVINQLRSNINLRMKQKDGSSRYQHALNVWRGDIWYVENSL